MGTHGDLRVGAKRCPRTFFVRRPAADSRKLVGTPLPKDPMTLRDVTRTIISLVENTSGCPVVVSEDASLKTLPDIEDTVFVVGESGTTYEINLFTSDSADQTVVISHIPKQLQVQAERVRQVPALDLMRFMMRGLPVDGYEIIKADKKEVYRDAFFSMKLLDVYRSPGSPWLRARSRKPGRLSSAVKTSGD